MIRITFFILIFCHTLHQIAFCLAHLLIEAALFLCPGCHFDASHLNKAFKATASNLAAASKSKFNYYSSTCRGFLSLYKMIPGLEIVHVCQARVLTDSSSRPVAKPNWTGQVKPACEPMIKLSAWGSDLDQSSQAELGTLTVENWDEYDSANIL